jgi:hypothetical protein
MSSSSDDGDRVKKRHKDEKKRKKSPERVAVQMNVGRARHVHGNAGTVNIYESQERCMIVLSADLFFSKH